MPPIQGPKLSFYSHVVAMYLILVPASFAETVPLVGNELDQKHKEAAPRELEILSQKLGIRCYSVVEVETEVLLVRMY
jgi:hypothetical protein